MVYIVLYIPGDAGFLLSTVDLRDRFGTKFGITRVCGVVSVVSLRIHLVPADIEKTFSTKWNPYQSEDGKKKLLNSYSKNGLRFFGFDFFVVCSRSMLILFPKQISTYIEDFLHQHFLFFLLLEVTEGLPSRKNDEKMMWMA